MISNGGNRRLAKKRVQWIVENPASYQLFPLWREKSFLVDSFVLRNPLLRQAPTVGKYFM